MSEGTVRTTDELKVKLSRQIDAAQGRLDALKKDVQNLRDEDVQALQRLQSEVGKRVNEQRERAQKLQVDISNWKTEKATHTKETVASWRQKHEIKKLERRAERAADYAIDMVTQAAMDFDDAEQAVLDAVIARVDANAAAASP